VLALWLLRSEARLIDQAGAATASVITYVMPVVALVLGVGLLGERLTVGAIAGLLLIGLGAWLATSRQAPRTIASRRTRHSTRPQPRLLTAAPDSKLYRGLGGEPPDRLMRARLVSAGNTRDRWASNRWAIGVVRSDGQVAGWDFVGLWQHPGRWAAQLSPARAHPPSLPG
jgi:EamA-like transporter family